ncbi:hypothetical protein AB0I10_33040 [Streptomyces sp. NPDC050636]|uniref:hypothetical protein n=1 Tax=Streptomyces sp. NPDC050636 TaxID=3154510 RepID=UPI0034445FDC
MTQHSNRPKWAAMSKAEFNEGAPNTLAVPFGPVRIAATPDAFGTSALFGEAPPPAAPHRRQAPEPGDIEGQNELF